MPSHSMDPITSGPQGQNVNARFVPTLNTYLTAALGLITLLGFYGTNQANDARTTAAIETTSKQIDQFQTTLQRLDEDRRNDIKKLEDDRRQVRTTIETRLGADEQNITKISGALDNITYQLGAQAKQIEAGNSRMDRMSANYSDRFASIDEKLGTISTNIAVLSQAVNELKVAWLQAPARPGSLDTLISPRVHTQP